MAKKIGKLSMRGIWSILAGWLILLPLIRGRPCSAQETQSSKDKTTDNQDKEDKKIDMQKILEQIGLKERLPGEDMEAWQRRIMEEYKKEIEVARQDKEILENSFKDFKNDMLQKNLNRKAGWYPTIEEADYIAKEVGLPDTQASHKLASKIMDHYLRDSNIKNRLNALKLENINIYNEMGAVFLVDAQDIFSVFVWYKTPRGWVLTGVAGAERTYFIQTAQRFRSSIIQAEKEVSQFVFSLLKAHEVSSYFAPDAIYLEKAWISLQDSNYLNDAKIESIKLDVDSMDAEVQIQAAGEPIILNLQRTKQGYKIISINAVTID